MKMKKNVISANYNMLGVALLLTLLVTSFCNWSIAAADVVTVSERENFTAQIQAAGTGGRLPPPPKVKVNKCCRFGEHLDITKSCVQGNSKSWVPHIFLINKRSHFIPKGESPKFLTFEENVLPVNDSTPNEAQQQLDTEAGCTADELELFTGGDSIVIFSNGSLFLREHSQFIDPRKYCVDREAALVCFPKEQQKKSAALPKIKKCCGKHGVYNMTANNCQFEKSNNLLQLPVSDADMHTIYGFPKCQNATLSFAIAGSFQEAQLDTKTGNLQLHHKNFKTEDYCLEHISAPSLGVAINDNAKDSTVKIFACLHHFDKNKDAVVGPEMKGETTAERIQVAVLNAAIIISAIFLAATLVAGFLIPSVHHVLHWRCQICYVFCLFAGELLLAYTQLTKHAHLGTTTCTIIASSMHFFFLSAFFWLNTMCFNIWWTFRDFRPSSLERNQELFRLRLYSAYAWGIPFLIAAVTVCIDQWPNSDLLKPGFGERSCWFSGYNMEIFAYFFGPVGILLCANIALFISTTHQLTCGLWKRDDVKSTTEKTALGKICFKLVIVMGVTWIADVISWLVGGPYSAWFFTDLINALQGVFIFLVFGCQPQVWASVKRLCCRGARQEITNTTNGVHHSSSSHGLPSLTACGETTQNTSINMAHGKATQTKIPMETVC